MSMAASIAIMLQLFSKRDSRCWHAQVSACQKAAGSAASGHRAAAVLG